MSLRVFLLPTRRSATLQRLVLVIKSLLLRVLTLSSRMARLLSSTKMVKSFCTICGLPGALLAKLPWHTTKKCLLITRRSGVAMSELSVSVSIMMLQLLRNTLRLRDGKLLSIITLETVHARPLRLTDLVVFPTFSSLTSPVKLHSWVTQLPETLSKTSTICLKTKLSLVKALAPPLLQKRLKMVRVTKPQLLKLSPSSRLTQKHS
mmetsp:Transcript_22096/g.30452  ORF Transcript_22096/g.30452 Transcript_22096/m.30452 type:complete len:206 (+) Transcript_22096:353-970(+)